MANKHRKHTTKSERYQLIMECRSSGRSDAQWCQEQGIPASTFYRWIHDLRKTGIYDIPDAVPAEDYLPATKQDVVKLEIIPDQPEQVVLPQNQMASYTDLPNQSVTPSIEIMHGDFTMRICNNADPMLLKQILNALGNQLC